jgi:E3 ubiquitin-protein ligase NEDD4
MENDITDVIYSTFSVEDERFGEKVTVDLKPGGRDIEVDNDNKKEYVDLITEWRIQKRVEEQFNAFVQGFHELIPADLVNVFDERELELLIGGIADIDVDDWKKHTDYRGYTENDAVVQNFWKVCPFSIIFLHNIHSLTNFRSASAAGTQSKSPVSCNSQPEPRVSRSTASKTSRVQTDPEDSPLRRAARRPNFPNRIPASTGWICLLTSLMMRSIKSSPGLWRRRWVSDRSKTAGLFQDFPSFS